MKHRSYLLFGAPGSGKGTQGNILGKIPGFIHISTGELFRNLHVGSALGRTFLDYSARGELVPDSFTIQLWHEYVDGLQQNRGYDSETETLILDGIPRNVRQAELMEEYIDVKRVYYLHCKDKEVMYRRLQTRALLQNRMDDASNDVIDQRLRLYEEETFPVLEHYSNSIIRHIETTRSPVEVLADIVADMAKTELELHVLPRLSLTAAHEF